jgi:hypothetical protein
MSVAKLALIALAVASAPTRAASAPAAPAAHVAPVADDEAEATRAAPGDEVVLARLFPKAHRFELELGPALLLNPAFVETQVALLEARYFTSETWGFGLALGLARTQDRRERACVESFYNDPDHKGQAPCAAQDGGDSARAAGGAVDVGPAYVRIRELRALAVVTVDYALAYGKQILLHGATSHFDLRLRGGAGLAQSVVYAEELRVRGEDRPSRGDPQGRGGAPRAGVDVDDVGPDGRRRYGEEGRPAPTTETAPLLYGAVVQTLHFAKRFYVAPELGVLLLAAPGDALAPLVTARVSLGVRY